MKIKYSMMTRLILLLSVTSIPVLAHGAPEIRGVSADQADGDTLVITGSDFSSAEFPIILDTVDRWRVTQQNNTYSTLSASELWSEEGSAWASPLEVVSGPGPFGEADNTLYYGKKKSYNRYFSPFKDENNRSLYVSWWFKPTQHPDSDGGSNKFIRIWDEDGGENTRISWTNMHLTYSAEDLGIGGVDWKPWSGDPNRWNLMEIYVNADNNIIKTWVNGDLLHDVKDFRKSPIDKGLNAKLIGFDPSVSDPYKNLEFNIDNVYVAKTPARVVASEFKSWDLAKKDHRTLFPIMWTSNEINVKSEALLKDDQVYFLYVIDKTGAANSRGVSLCPKCPSRIELNL